MWNKNHEYQKHIYDKQSKPLAPLEIEYSVRLQQNDRSWKPAIVLSKADGRSYIVKRWYYHRYRRHLMTTNEQTFTSDPNLPILYESPNRWLKVKSNFLLLIQITPVLSTQIQFWKYVDISNQ